MACSSSMALPSPRRICRWRILESALNRSGPRGDTWGGMRAAPKRARTPHRSLRQSPFLGHRETAQGRSLVWGSSNRLSGPPATASFPSTHCTRGDVWVTGNLDWGNLRASPYHPCRHPRRPQGLLPPRPLRQKDSRPLLTPRAHNRWLS